MRLADGTTVGIDDRALADRLSATDDGLARAVADLELLVAQSERAARPGLDPAEADARLRQMVGEHRAREAQVSLADAIARAIVRFLADLRGAPPDPRVPIVAVGGVGTALLLVVLAIMGRDIRERFRREVVLPELRAERGPDPAALLRRADEALASGRAREAIHALYLFAIAALAAREVIRLDPSLTDRELLSRAGAIPQAGALRDLVDLHERIWYGLRDARGEDAARARRLALQAAP
mgnify:FL=1